MYKTLKNFAAAGAVAAVALMSGQAMAASATGDASVTIATPIAVSQSTALSFGTVAVGATGGTVVLDHASATTVTGDVSKLGGTIASGAFLVTGLASQNFTVTVPASTTLTSGANSMTTTLTTDTASGSIGGSGTTFHVGGTLTVAGGQATGTYNGTYSVTVNYN